MVNHKIVIFKGKAIRRHWDGNKELWFFSVIDVMSVLTGSTIPRRYWSDLKIKLQKEGSEVYEKIVQLKMQVSSIRHPSSLRSKITFEAPIAQRIEHLPSPPAKAPFFSDS